MAAEELHGVDEVGVESRSPSHSGSPNAPPNSMNHSRISLELAAIDVGLEAVMLMMMMMMKLQVISWHMWRKTIQSFHLEP